jgi:hypothetical protein
MGGANHYDRRPVAYLPGGFSIMKGERKMSIDELKLALDRIPPTNAINRARRRAIIVLINRLSTEGKS